MIVVNSKTTYLFIYWVDGNIKFKICTNHPISYQTKPIYSGYYLLGKLNITSELKFNYYFNIRL